MRSDNGRKGWGVITPAPLQLDGSLAGVGTSEDCSDMAAALSRFQGEPPPLVHAGQMAGTAFCHCYVLRALPTLCESLNPVHTLVQSLLVFS